MRKQFTLLLAILILLLMTSCQKKQPGSVETDPTKDPVVTPGETDEPAPDIPDDLKKDQMTEYHVFTQGWYGHAPLDITDVGVAETGSDLVVQAS